MRTSFVTAAGIVGAALLAIALLLPAGAAAQSDDDWDHLWSLVPSTLTGTCEALYPEEQARPVPSVVQLVCMENDGHHKVDDVGLFLFENETKLRDWWERRTKRIAGDTGDPLRTGKCRKNVQGIQQTATGEVICYRQSGDARVRWIDVDNLLYGSLDTDWTRIAWAYDWWTKNIADSTPTASAVASAEQAARIEAGGETTASATEATIGGAVAAEGQTAPSAAQPTVLRNGTFQRADIVSELPFYREELDLSTVGSDDWHYVGDCSRVRRSIWYRFDPSEDMVVGFEAVASPIVGNDDGVGLSIFEGERQQRLRQQACADTYSFDRPAYASVPVQAGKTYYVQVGHGLSGGGLVDLGMTLHEPQNDFFETATRLRLDQPHVEPLVDLTRAGHDDDQDYPSCARPEQTIWYRVKPEADQTLRLTVSPADSARESLAPVVAIYEGGKRKRLHELACENNYDNLPISLDVPVNAGRNYMIQVGTECCSDQPALSVVQTAPQSVELPELVDRPFTTGPILLSSIGAAASSGLPVSFTASGACSLAGDELQLQDAGTCTIEAYQPGADGWEASGRVSGSFEVAALPQKLTFPALGSMTYGQPIPALAATTSSGQPVEYVTEGACEVQGGSLLLIAAGDCVVTATQPGGGGYTPAESISQSISISPASQRIEFELPAQVAWGDEPIPLLATSTAGLPVELSTEGGCRVDAGSLVLDAVGTCLVAASQPGDQGTAAATTVTLELSVVPRTQAIVFLPLETAAFDADPMRLQAIASSGLAITYDAEGPCDIDGLDVAFTGAGTCTITARQDGDEGWAAADPVTQALTIAAAEQVIDFEPPTTALLGAPALNLDATASSGLPVAVSADGPCQLDGSDLVLDGDGICTLVAEQAGNERHAAAPAVERRIEVVAPMGGELDLLGEVATEAPGTFIAPGSVVDSLLDITRRPREVFALALRAGQELTVTIESEGQQQTFEFMPPVDTAAGEAETWLPLEGMLVAPISGIYQIAVTDDSDGAGAYRYSASFEVAGQGPEPLPADAGPVARTVDLSGDVPVAPPGLSVASGAKVSSVLDPTLRPEEHYEIDLSIGNTLDVLLESAGPVCPDGCIVEIAYPGEINDPDGPTWIELDGPWLASEDGAYALRARLTSAASGPARYSLAFTVSE